MRLDAVEALEEQNEQPNQTEGREHFTAGGL